MRVVVYRRITLLDGENDLYECLRWAKRRRLPIPAVVQEHTERGRKLKRVVSTLRAGDLLVVPRLYNLAVDTPLTEVLQRLLANSVGIVFVLDGVALKAGSQRSKSIVELCSALKEIDRMKRKESRKRGVLIAQWMGKQVGRVRISAATRTEVEAHLREGKKVAEIVKLMNGEIARTSVFAIARAMKAKAG